MFATECLGMKKENVQCICYSVYQLISNSYIQIVSPDVYEADIAEDIRCIISLIWATQCSVMVHMLVVQFPCILIHTGLLTKITTETVLTEYTTAPSAQQEH